MDDDYKRSKQDWVTLTQTKKFPSLKQCELLCQWKRFLMSSSNRSVDVSDIADQFSADGSLCKNTPVLKTAIY